MSLKPFAMLMLIGLLVHQPIYGSSLRPRGIIVGAGTTGGGCPGCVTQGFFCGDISVLNILVTPVTALGGPGMCLGDSSAIVERVGDVGVFCAPDTLASPCFGNAVDVSLGFDVGFVPSLQPVQFRVDLAATMTGAGAGGGTSGAVNVCPLPSLSTVCSTIPFQVSGNGVISVSLVETLFAPNGINASIDINSMPAGATLNIGNFVVNSIPPASQTGIVKVCETSGVGIGPGMPVLFNLEQFTLTAPPVSQVIKVPGELGSESCSDNLPFAKGSLVVVHELAPNRKITVYIDGTLVATDILRGTAATVIGNSPVKLSFTSKALGTEGCRADYYRTHLDMFPFLLQPSSPLLFLTPAFAPIATLLDVLDDAGQTPAALLSRSAVAALLNAAHPEVAYAFTIGDALQLIENAFATNDQTGMLTLSKMFDSANAGPRGCPLQ